MLFAGITVAFNTKQFAPKRLEILTKLFKSNGGRVVDLTSDTHDSAILTERYDENLSQERQVSVEWLSQSLEKGILLEEDDYILSANSKKRKLHEDLHTESSGDEDSHSQGKSLLAEGYANARYECQRMTPLICPNQKLVELLGRLEEHRYLTANERSALSYRKGMAAIRAYPRVIESEAEAAALKGIGPKIARFVGEYLRVGTIYEAENCLTEPRIKALQELTEIFGIGPKRAAQLLDKEGIKSIAELRKAQEEGRVKLSADQEAGLKYHADLRQEVSRQIAESVLEDIQTAVDKAQLPPCRVTLVGGFRRGKTTGHDVDVLVSPQESESVAGFIRDIVSQLQDAGRIEQVLHFHESKVIAKAPMISRVGSSLKKSPAHRTTAMDNLDKCLCIYRPQDDVVKRRVDIIVAPRSQYAFALLGWSGSRQFERSIRLYALREKKMMLSSNGLIDKRSGHSFPATSEEEIFKVLGLEWIPPEYRHC